MFNYPHRNEPKSLGTSHNISYPYQEYSFPDLTVLFSPDPLLVTLTSDHLSMFGLQESVASVGLGQARGPVTALKEEPLGHGGLTARTWMQPGIVDTQG